MCQAFEQTEAYAHVLALQLGNLLLVIRLLFVVLTNLLISRLTSILQNHLERA